MSEKEKLDEPTQDLSVKELKEKIKEVETAYANLATAFNRLMKEYNDLHMLNLFRKE